MSPGFSSRSDAASAAMPDVNANAACSHHCMYYAGEIGAASWGSAEGAVVSLEVAATAAVRTTEYVRSATPPTPNTHTHTQAVPPNNTNTCLRVLHPPAELLEGVAGRVARARIVVF